MKDDIRNHGSGNAGATNVFRVMGWKPALFVVLIDIAKGSLASLVISQIVLDPVPLDSSLIKMLAGAFAIIGHIWTVFAGFKGGKGVGTTFGVLLCLTPVPVLVSLLVWLTIVLTSRIVSLGSLIAAVVFPTLLFIQRQFINPNIPQSYLYLSLILSIMIIVTHRSNIIRLLKGNENRFRSSKEKMEGIK
jgi:glycerol-3-phosphate acyltransferase PlsY